MDLRIRTSGELRFACLVASVEAVLADAKASGEELRPKQIGDRAGIPENAYRTQEIVTGILHYLEDNKRVVRRRERKAWVQP